MNTLAMSLLFGCAGVMLAWLLGRPARRLAGAGPAFCLWLLPPLMAAVAWLPAWPAATPHAAGLLTLPVLFVAPAVDVAAAQPGLDIADLVFVVWLAGASVMLLRLLVHSRHILRVARSLPDAMRTALKPDLAGLDARVVRLHPAGPAVCWLPRCRMLLPADMLERFDVTQRRQVLAHERTHLARGDAMWSLAAECVLAVLWFFPPAWFAVSRFHLDQELACDAAIVNRRPWLAGAYARALLAGGATSRQPTLTTAWLSRSQLKERLTMIQHHSHSLLASRTGYAVLFVTLAGVALAAHAALPASPQPAVHPPLATATSVETVSVTLPSPSQQDTADQTTGTHPVVIVDPTYKATHPPRYPPDAIKNHEQGTVVLLVLVGTDGKPQMIKSVSPNVAPSLVAAAKKAASEWRYTPARRNGKPFKAWTRIPVIFELPAQPPKPISVAGHAVPDVSVDAHKPANYPPQAKKRHKQGTVVLLVLVDKNGKPEKVKITKAIPDAPALNAAAVKAAKGWSFNPGTRGGKPYAAWARVPVTFRLNPAWYSDKSKPSAASSVN